MENLTGKHVDRYQILELLGQGGMAMVYKAYDPRLEREVALKIIRLEAFPPEDLHDVRKRFEREAKALAQLSHPNIIKVMDYGEHENSPFLVMEHLQGGTLKQMLGEPMSWQEAMQLLLPIARGLEYAHRRGIVHRDIKPANILMTENGEPTLSDFGIVKLFQGEKTALTASGTAIGTPEYMAPEQWTGETTVKSDMYSLGVVLYEIITGRRPYIADTPGGVFLKQVTEPLPLPRDMVPDLPESAERFLLKVLAKEPSERYADLGAFVRELESLLTEHSFQVRYEKLDSSKPVKVQKAGTERKAFLLPRTNRRWVSVVIVAIVLIGLVFGGVFGLAPLLNQPENTPESTLTLTEEVEQEPNQPVTVAAEISPTSEATSTPVVTTTPEPGIGSSWTRPEDGMEMMYIPAGEFLMGSESGSADERPVHTVFLDAFWIDQTEVTNDLYVMCMDDGQCDDPKGDKRSKVLDYSTHPVSANWEMANAYCLWAGARLPTEAEWEKAARGALVGKEYPWGDEEPSCQPGTKNGAQSYECSGQAVEVKTFMPNGYGLYDMTGNVWEWVADWYSADYYTNSPSTNPKGPNSGSVRAMRGGSWVIYDGYVRSANRSGINPTDNYESFGFRCASSIVGESPESEESTPETPQASSATNSPVSMPPTEIIDDFGTKMALVPAGEFTMGDEDGEDDEKPVHTVYLDAYYIDKYEVTNAYYQTCVVAGVCKLPKKTGSSQVDNYYGNPQYDNYPVLYVDWNMAKTYCEWRQAGLPTEAQWEKAARGTDGRLFPWGFEPKGCPVANYQTCFGNPTEVGIFPEGASPYGLLDMAGNVSEWVWDWYDPEYYIESPLNNPKGPSTGDYRVMRGGSWSQYSISARVSYRYRGNPDGSNDTIGFRCARDATP